MPRIESALEVRIDRRHERLAGSAGPCQSTSGEPLEELPREQVERGQRRDPAKTATPCERNAV